MMLNQKLQISRLTFRTDGLTSTFSATYDEPLYGKIVKFQTPNYCLPLTISPNINIRELRLEIDHLLSAHTKFYSVKVFDYENVIASQIKKIQQRTLDGSYASQKFRDFFFGNVMIFDFAPESLEYIKNLKKYSYSPRLPKKIVTLANELVDDYEKLSTSAFMKIREKKVSAFWENVMQSTKKLNEFEGQVFDEGLNCFGDIILPFTKLIKSNGDLLDVKKINDEWIKLNRIHDKPTVAYLLIHPKILRNDVLVLKIIEYLKELKVDVLVFKIKNLELTDGSKHVLPRENLKEILKAISEKKQKEDILTIALEAGEQMYPFSLQAFDVISTSATMYDKETSSGGGISDAGMGYGSAIEEESLARLDFSMWKKEFDRQNLFPCTHDFCRKRITTMDTKNYPNFVWQVDSRRHNMLTIDGWLQMVSQSVVDKQAGLAFNRLENSPLRILSELLVSNYSNKNPF